MTKEFYLSSDSVTKDCKKISQQILQTGIKIARIVAVTRGGMLPACLIAQYLNIREIHTLAMYSYRPDNTQGDIVTLVSPNVPDEQATLFVDDLINSGNTAKYLQKHFPNSSLCVIYSKQNSSDTIVPPLIVPDDALIVFPWEASPLSSM